MNFVRRGALAGAGFGVAAALVGVWFQLLPAWITRIPQSASVVSFGAVFEIVLATALGVVLAPLLRLPLGRFLHLGALAALWTMIQIVYEFDSPILGAVARFGSLIALVLYGVGIWMGRRARWVGAASGLVLLAAGIAAPHVYLALTTPERAVLAELPPAAPGAPDVVLIVLDTVRAENMSAYGYARETTPRFDSLAREAASAESKQRPRVIGPGTATQYSPADLAAATPLGESSRAMASLGSTPSRSTARR